MSTSRVEAKRAERRMWSNHKKYLRRRGMHAQPKKEYRFVPFKPFELPKETMAKLMEEKRKLGWWARLVRWVRGKR